MTRIDLRVPFAEKDDAKRLGARWDAVKKVWYVPAGLDSALFGKWLPREPEGNLRAPSYAIAQSAAPCWKCGRQAHAFSFLLPAGHEVLEDVAADESDEGIWEWVRVETPTIVHYVEQIPLPVQRQMSALSGNSYRLDYSKTTQSSYWMNHCHHCGMKQGDFGMHCEPGGAFMPMDEHAASGISLRFIGEPFAASCGGYSVDVDFLNHMRRF
ncbi:DUF5710 domain-containing protein [Azospirillum agricola]|uniref:DUF5710 domain-containing protein n=1 Tax=Azospirillum agricola TaxID=1720247 RepID=UPI000A0F2529|nr:DUF5710 domain-containing protein [Azospirillum agricola]SMH43322.1 hypothetical protein SAMN02982994_1864 [Azospirillum lipoferum]